jgi:hypothetical protein
MVSGILGYASGIEGQRPVLSAHIMVLLIVLLVFIIIDLDRPRRGLTEINQQSLRDVHALIPAHTPAGNARR